MKIKSMNNFGAQMKASLVADMEKVDEFETDEFVINNYKN